MLILVHSQRCFSQSTVIWRSPYANVRKNDWRGLCSVNCSTAFHNRDFSHSKLQTSELLWEKTWSIPWTIIIVYNTIVIVDFALNVTNDFNNLKCGGYIQDTKRWFHLCEKSQFWFWTFFTVVKWCETLRRQVNFQWELLGSVKGWIKPLVNDEIKLLRMMPVSLLAIKMKRVDS